MLVLFIPNSQMVYQVHSGLLPPSQHTRIDYYYYNHPTTTTTSTTTTTTTTTTTDDGDDDESDVLLPLIWPLTAERDFLINGWRWHSQSVLRDLGRFRRVAEQELSLISSSSSSSSRLPECFSFLWGFSWAALMRIESELFFPWLRQKLPEEAWAPLDKLDKDRIEVCERFSLTTITATTTTMSIVVYWS